MTWRWKPVSVDHSEWFLISEGGFSLWPCQHLHPRWLGSVMQIEKSLILQMAQINFINILLNKSLINSKIINHKMLSILNNLCAIFILHVRMTQICSLLNILHFTWMLNLDPWPMTLANTVSLFTDLWLLFDWFDLLVELGDILVHVVTELVNVAIPLSYRLIDSIPDSRYRGCQGLIDGKVLRRGGHMVLINQIIHLLDDVWLRLQGINL